MGKKIRCYEVIKKKWIWMDKEELDRFFADVDQMIEEARHAPQK